MAILIGKSQLEARLHHEDIITLNYTACH